MNGSVWVWPLWFYVKASFDLGGREFLPRAEELLARFGEEIQSYGIGSINELFDGDPPHAPWGAVSQAWSVGAVLMIRETTERWRRRRGHGLLPGLRKALKDAKEKNLPPRKVSEIFSVGPGRPGWRLPGGATGVSRSRISYEMKRDYIL